MYTRPTNVYGGHRSGEETVTKICGVFLLLSGVLGLVAGPIAMRIDYPVFADFGDGETLSRFAAAWPTPFLFGLLQISLPCLALASSLGFYYWLKDAGAIVVLGVVLNALGLVFTTIQDGIEVALLHYLPTAYLAAEEPTRPALLAIGDFGETAMGVFGRLGIIAYVGLLLVNVEIWTLGRWRWVATLYFVAFVLIVIASTAAAVVPSLGVLFPVAFMLLRVWMISAALIMLRSGSGAVSDSRVLS
jgi:hypothetical protein